MSEPRNPLLEILPAIAGMGAGRVDCKPRVINAAGVPLEAHASELVAGNCRNLNRGQRMFGTLTIREDAGKFRQRMSHPQISDRLSVSLKLAFGESARSQRIRTIPAKSQ